MKKNSVPHDFNASKQHHNQGEHLGFQKEHHELLPLKMVSCDIIDTIFKIYNHVHCRSMATATLRDVRCEER